MAAACYVEVYFVGEGKGTVCLFRSVMVFRFEWFEKEKTRENETYRTVCSHFVEKLWYELRHLVCSDVLRHQPRVVRGEEG